MVKPHPIDESGPMRKYAQAINRAVDFAASMQLLRGKSYRVRKTTSGQLIDFESTEKSEAIEPGNVQRFYLDEEYDDHLDCRKADADGIPYGSSIFIAKPLSLRVSTYNGDTVSALGGTFTVSYQSGNARRFTDASGYYWDEELWPTYQIGASDIYACEPDGGPGLTLWGTTPLTWLDMNLNTRHFRPKMTQLATCVVENGVNVVKYIYVSGGPVQA